MTLYQARVVTAPPRYNPAPYPKATESGQFLVLGIRSSKRRVLQLQFPGGEDFQHMHGTKKNWLSLSLLLIALAAPITARADYYWTSHPGGSGGGSEDSGDPDNPTPYGSRMEPGQRSGRAGGGDSRYQVTQPFGSDSWIMRRYHTLLSGLRSYYLRF